MKIQIKESKRVLQAAQHLFGKDAVVAAYVCADIFDSESSDKESIERAAGYALKSIDISSANELSFNGCTFMLRFANGKEVMFSSSYYASMYPPEPKTEFVEV